MAVLDIKGVHVGEGRPKTIVSLMDAEPTGLLAQAERAVAAGADCLEWRADFAASLDSATLAKTAHMLGAALPRTPLIFTLRTESQGGRCQLDVARQQEVLRTATRSGGIDLVDLELGLGDETVRELASFAHDHGVLVIVSHHDFSGTPDVTWMTSCLLHMAALGADIPKLAVMAQGPADALHLMEATVATKTQFEGPLLTMAMGGEGTLTRLAGETFGSALTFCALGRASAPGQVGFAQARSAMDALHEALRQGDVR